MTVRRDWIDAVQALASDLVLGAEPDPERVRGLLEQAEEMAREGTVEDVHELQEVLDQLRQICVHRKDLIQDQMATLGRTREALKGYGVLDEHYKGQRLQRKA